jgi:hypothetical protein
MSAHVCICLIYVDICLTALGAGDGRAELALKNETCVKKRLIPRAEQTVRCMSLIF